MLLKGVCNVIFLYFLLLLILPIFIYALLSRKFGVQWKISTYYVIEIWLVGIVTTAAQFYYYFFYNLAIFPSKEYMKLFIYLSLAAVVILYLWNFIYERFKKEKELTHQTIAIIALSMLVITIWFIPIFQKNSYINRLDSVDKIIEEHETGRIVSKEDITISFISSERERYMRKRYASLKYNNYFYIKNDRDEKTTFDMTLFLYNEKGESIGIKNYEAIEVDARSTELFVANPTDIAKDEWSQISFTTKQQVDTFDGQMIVR